MINEYDEIKLLLKRSRMLTEQSEIVNLGKSIETNINQDSESKNDNTELKRIKVKLIEFLVDF